MKKILALPLLLLLSCSQDTYIPIDNQNEYNLEEINLQLEKLNYKIEDLQTQINVNSSYINNIRNNSSNNRLTNDRDYINNEMSVEMLQQMAEGNFIGETESSEYEETISVNSISKSDGSPIEKLKQLAKELKDENEDE